MLGLHHAAFCAGVRGMLCKKGNATLLRRSPCLVKAARLTGSTASQTAGVTTPPPAGRNWEVYRRQRDIAIRIVQSLTSKRMAIRPARDRPGHALAEMQRGGALQSRINDDAAIKSSV